MLFHFTDMTGCGNIQNDHSVVFPELPYVPYTTGTSYIYTGGVDHFKEVQNSILLKIADAINEDDIDRARELSALIKQLREALDA